MKKLIMMTVLALGSTISFASNEQKAILKNDYDEMGIEILSRYHVVVTELNLDLTTTTLLDEVTSCMTKTDFGRYMFVVNETYIISNPNGHRVSISTSQSVCW